MVIRKDAPALHARRGAADFADRSVPGLTMHDRIVRMKIKKI